MAISEYDEYTDEQISEYVLVDSVTDIVSLLLGHDFLLVMQAHSCEIITGLGKHLNMFCNIVHI